MERQGGFTISEGGRLFDLMVRVGLAGRPRNLVFRVFLVLAIGWIPPLVLAAGAGAAFGSGYHGFLGDLGPWVRFFLVGPLLIFAEPLADRVLGIVVKLFRDSGLVADAQAARFEALVARTERLATADTADVTALVIALTLPHLLASALPEAVNLGTVWFGSDAGGPFALNAAGRWYSWVSLPLIEFMLLRWLWRSLAWWGFLWRVSRLPLAVTPAHPDRAGGLFFLTWAPNAFVPLFASVSVLAAVSVANKIRISGTHLVEARAEIIALVVLELMLLLVPQLFFMPLLGRSKRQALIKYGLAGTRMGRGFDRRWTEQPMAGDQELIDSSDSSAMIDFAGTYDEVRNLRPTILSVQELVRFVLPLGAPFAPLLLFEYSLTDILKGVLALVR